MINISITQHLLTLERVLANIRRDLANIEPEPTWEGLLRYLDLHPEEWRICVQNKRTLRVQHVDHLITYTYIKHDDVLAGIAILQRFTKPGLRERVSSGVTCPTCCQRVNR